MVATGSMIMRAWHGMAMGGLGGLARVVHDARELRGEVQGDSGEEQRDDQSALNRIKKTRQAKLIQHNFGRCQRLVRADTKAKTAIPQPVECINSAIKYCC